MYRLRIEDEVKKQIGNLPGNLRQRVQRIIAELAANPRPANAQELRTLPGRYRIRIDRFRIVYHVLDDLLIVEVLKIGRKFDSSFYDDI